MPNTPTVIAPILDASRLYPPQRDIVEGGFLDLGFNTVLSLPTGAGKTTLAEMGIDRCLARGDRAVYLTPLRALAEEKIQAWANRWPGRKVGIFTGDYDSGDVPVPYRDAEILICTYERLDGCLRAWQRHLGWLSQLGLVVVDEFHLLMDPSRGPRLEGALTRLRRVNPFCQIIGLSGTVSNYHELARWLDGVAYHSTWRPVPLRHEVLRYKQLSDKPALVQRIVGETRQAGGQTLVFVNSRRRAEHLAKGLSDAGLPAGHHHAGLRLDDRRRIEAAFRSGVLAAVVATPTLEMGLNLPCRTVVVADHSRWNGETFTPLPTWNYLQRAGRAGRPGQDGEGTCYLLAPTWARDLPDYRRAQPEPVRSHLLRPAALAEQVLIEVCSRSCRTRDQLLHDFLPRTLAATHDHAQAATTFQACLSDLLQGGLIVETPNPRGVQLLHATPIGQVAIRHQLSPRTALTLLGLRDLVDGGIRDFDLLLRVCWDPDCAPVIPCAIEEVDLVEDGIHPIPSRLLDLAAPTTLPPRRIAAGVKMAWLLWARTRGLNHEALAAQTDVYPHDLTMLVDAVVRLLTAAADLHNAADPVTDPVLRKQRERFCGPSLVSRLRRLARQLAFGLDGTTVQLTLVDGIGGVTARKLADAGITDLETLANAEASDLLRLRGIGAARAQTWIDAATSLLSDLGNDEPEPPPPPRSVHPQQWPTDLDVGRLRRALTLKATRQAPRGPWVVTGGADEHQVYACTCDCADFLAHPLAPDGSSWWCKHRLAVAIAQQDRLIQTAVRLLQTIVTPPTVAGHLGDLVLGCDPTRSRAAP
jgi:helicase